MRTLTEEIIHLLERGYLHEEISEMLECDTETIKKVEEEVQDHLWNDEYEDL